ncbi:hypothetical protein THASP1DRAFT_23579 [Thamnocephalis sphaerospora]|uniref:Uncharacterized protein n=1 Tax=Thamnocephalis sphaerospora TaxID=78915 RepID=A0A4P9XQU4_9FUNG|nr:hypothetical protein THASP1DRAFT_23579 [Thamnocephalis sphaerospora]|eukprot:RKP08424.1 hypothetical protein THASP1DRAFT_23579 [Thamnocephalis sphaerospora]
MPLRRARADAIMRRPSVHAPSARARRPPRRLQCSAYRGSMQMRFSSMTIASLETQAVQVPGQRSVMLIWRLSATRSPNSLEQPSKPLQVLATSRETLRQMWVPRLDITGMQSAAQHRRSTVVRPFHGEANVETCALKPWREDMPSSAAEAGERMPAVLGQKGGASAWYNAMRGT